MTAPPAGLALNEDHIGSFARTLEPPRLRLAAEDDERVQPRHVDEVEAPGVATAPRRRRSVAWYNPVGAVLVSGAWIPGGDVPWRPTWGDE